ncbi:MAG: CHAT domain-containing protein [Desulfobacterales bacterium]|nr:CHAT domain-containing protein [Desulfobacterales bacterium]
MRFIFVILLISSSAFAQVITDGSAGKAVSLPGSDYSITADLGKQSGGNLFHSFSQFSINTDENAIFSGPDSVQNIISRVTGGESSWIDGGLISEIPGANLYLMNPSGVMFGSNACLDLSGSFHVTTANGIPLGQEGHFSANLAQKSILTADPPEAFGFTGRAPITLNETLLVSPENDISLSGSDIIINNSFLNVSGDLENAGHNSGNISISGNSITSEGSIFYLKSYSKGGDINFDANEISFSESVVNTVGLKKTGNISISGDSIFIMNNSEIHAKSAEQGGIIDISGKYISVADGTLIGAHSYGPGTGTHININAEQLDMYGISEEGYYSEISIANLSSTEVEEPGRISIVAENLTIKDEACIDSFTTAYGNGGTIDIDVSNITLSGFDTGIYSSVEPTGTADGGEININAETVTLEDGAYITSTTYGMGNAGNINIAVDDLRISGTTDIGWASSVTAGANPKPAEETDFLKGGNGGEINIDAKNITLTDGGLIASSSIAQPKTEAGEAGIINITADTVTATGVNPYGPNEDGYGSGIYARSYGIGADDAGRISISADRINLSEGGTVNTESTHKGGGVIGLNVSDQLYLHNGNITTSVAQGEGQGGDITLESNLVAMNRGNITAKADAGDGGAIFISAGSFFRSSDSLVSATSARGNDGTVTVDAPDTELNELTVLPSVLPDISGWTDECGRSEDKSRFVVRGKDNAPVSSVRGLRSGISDSDFSDSLAAVRTAVRYQYAGFQKKALEMLNDFASDAKNLSTEDQIVFLNTLADLQTANGFFREAAKSLEQSRDLSFSSGSVCLQAQVFNLIGNVFFAAGDADEAEAAYETALESARQGDCSNQEVRILINLAMLSESESENRYLDKALAAVKELPQSYSRTSDLVSVAVTALKNNSLRIASDALAEARKSSEIPSLSHYILGYLGQAYEKKKQYKAASDLTRKALFYAGSGYPESRYLWEWQLARLHKAQGDTEKAAEYYRKAIKTLTPIRHTLYADYRMIGIFAEEIRPVYLGLADLLLSRGKIAEGRDVMESLKKAEMQEYFLDNCIAEKAQAEPVNHTQPGTAVIYPIIFPDRLSVILTLPSGMKEISISVDSDTVVRTALLFRKQLQNRADNYFLITAETLYDWLIAPILNDLDRENTDTLVIVPDGVLRLVPFAALHDGSRFLVESCAVSYTPALDFVSPEQSQQGQTLISGLSDAVQGFKPLPNVRKELGNVRQITNSRTILYNADYTSDNLTHEIQNSGCSDIHLATHAVFGGTPKETFLLTYDSRIDMNGLESLIDSGRQDVDLLVLSACQTALGDDRAALGLAGTAVKAGVNSAVATLWFVNDVSTTELVTEFYLQIRSGQTKAKALQEAQKKLIAQDRFWKPVFWAPFLLIGDWI